MTERNGNITTLPIDHPIRKRVDDRLAWFEQKDGQYSLVQPGPYAMDRTAADYIRDFRGLEHLFAYAKSVSPRIFDIGAGTTQAVSELAGSYMGQGLEFAASTTQALLPHARNLLGREKIFITSAEYLEGVANESVGVALAMMSITYSAAPEYAIRRVDEILVPGGALKATFPNDTRGHLPFSPHDAFTMELKELGYDIEMTYYYFKQIVLAIKPGKEGVSAKELLKKDKLSADLQAVQVPGRSG